MPHKKTTYNRGLLINSMCNIAPILSFDNIMNIHDIGLSMPIEQMQSVWCFFAPVHTCTRHSYTMYHRESLYFLIFLDKVE